MDDDPAPAVGGVVSVCIRHAIRRILLFVLQTGQFSALSLAAQLVLALLLHPVGLNIEAFKFACALRSSGCSVSNLPLTVFKSY